jgi:uncharacterized protein YecE (DUF72 family)
MALLLGCSGWSYDDWVGPFYPKEVVKKDWLGYYGRFFSTVEINSTFYAVPNKFTVASWVQKGKAIGQVREDRFGGQAKDQAQFRFSLKLPLKITHEHMVKWDLVKAKDDLKGFELAVLDPLKVEGLIGAVLIQMSPYFRFEPDEKKQNKSIKALKGLLEALPLDGMDWAIELRHRSWVKKGRGSSVTLVPEAGDLLKEHKIILCETDGPGFPGLRQKDPKKVYLRFHGRNQDLWFKKGSGSSKGMDAKGKDKMAVEPDDEAPDPKGRFNRYDYLYSEEELKPWKERLEEEEKGYVYFNNHPRGKGPKNALMLMDLLGVKHEAKDIKISVQRTLF